MLVDFLVENFLSIREEAIFSLIATNSKHYRDTHVIEYERHNGVNNPALLRSAAIYGANSSGKSNFLKALSAMRRTVLFCNLDLLKSLPVCPYKLSKSTRDAPSVFEVRILVDGVRYQYGFSATKESIHKEWLFAYPKGIGQMWFRRSKDEYTFGRWFKGDKKLWQKSTRPSALFLSTAVQLNSQQLQPVFNWFSNILHTVNLDLDDPSEELRSCIRLEEKNMELRQFLFHAGYFNISGIKISENYPFDDVIISHEINGETAVDFSFSEESSGFRKLLNFAASYINAFNTEQVLLIDDLDIHLHPILVNFLVTDFNRQSRMLFLKDGRARVNQKTQLVFSTHDILPLKLGTLRSDQIWFCEDNMKQGTKIYSLCGFKGRNHAVDSDDVVDDYLIGRYGAIPICPTSVF